MSEGEYKENDVNIIVHDNDFGSLSIHYFTEGYKVEYGDDKFQPFFNKKFYEVFKNFLLKTQEKIGEKSSVLILIASYGRGE